MSTQHRPTFHFAVGQSGGPTGLRTYHFSSKDQTAHTKLKYRRDGQASSSDMKYRDLAAELDRREKDFLEEKHKHIESIEEEEKAVDTKQLLLTSGAGDDSVDMSKYDDADAGGSDSGFGSSR